eukprot:GFUD01017977.1.p1 GENE.GFUD01017977.1~~GFUD01017977.1.p1  ORF type:complete len:495 (-),score=145.53 GFUD01017977.1:1213-2598(-)
MDVRISDGWLRIPAKSGKKSKSVRSPFWFFMMEQKERWEQEDKWDKKKTMEELVQATIPIWKENKADPVFLAPYIEQHREWKMNRMGDLENKYDSLGRSLADIQREAQRVRKKEEDMNKEIEETVIRAGNTVARTSFFVAHFNFLCRTQQDFYIPCEGAVVEFSLEKGVIRCWQEFLSPLDSIPVGYKYKCIQSSRVTHNLTPDFEHYQTDYSKIMASLVQFLGGGDKQPPLYVMPDHVDAADCITQFITNKANSQLDFKIFSLPKLLQELGHYPSIHIAQALMEEDRFSHHAGLGCQFHESLGNPHHCSLSICKRMLFTLSASCSNLYRLHLKPGRHLPPDQVEHNLANKLQLSHISFVTEERINRKVPTPGGVTAMPTEFDPKLMVQRRDSEYCSSKAASNHVSVPATPTLSVSHVLPMSMGAIPKTTPFKARDIREKAGRSHGGAPAVHGWGDNIRLL